MEKKRKLVYLFISVVIVIIIFVAMYTMFSSPSNSLCGYANYTSIQNKIYGGWIGYVGTLQNKNLKIEGIKGIFTVPSTKHTPLAQNEGIAIWLGIGGYYMPMNTLIQAGAEIDNLSIFQSTVYYPLSSIWFEQGYTKNSIKILLVPNSSVSVSIQLINLSKDSWNATIQTLNYTKTFIANYSAVNSVEAVIELPNFQISAPPAFSRVMFSNITVKVCNSTTCALCPFVNMFHTTLEVQIYNTSNSSRWLDIRPSLLSSNNSFYITYEGTLPISNVSAPAR